MAEVVVDGVSLFRRHPGQALHPLPFHKGGGLGIARKGFAYRIALFFEADNVLLFLVHRHLPNRCDALEKVRRTYSILQMLFHHGDDVGVLDPQFFQRLDLGHRILAPTTPLVDGVL